MASFSQQLKIATDASKEDLQDTLQRSVLALMAVATQKTPVDKGRAINNWFCELGDKNIDRPERVENKSGNGSLGAIIETVGRLETGGEILLYNNLPYIEKLESGTFSAKAPNGMVRAAVASWGQIVESNKK